MKVFLSWSSERSKALAVALRDWLPMVLQYVEPWLSEKDISAGERWALSIAGELESSNFGIICVTPENLSSEWVLFEAGALSKSMLDGKVVPLLFGLELSDLSGPLSQFQAQKVDLNGITQIVKSINKHSGSKTQEQTVEKLIPALWPTLQEALKGISDKKPTGKHTRPQHEILEELVTGIRGLDSRMRDFDPEMSDFGRLSRRRRMMLHPKVFDELMHSGIEKEEMPILLLIMAGLLRNDFPWLAEFLSELYREVRDAHGDSEKSHQFRRSLSQRRRSLKQMIRIAHHPMIFDHVGGSKEFMMMFEELPMLLDRLLEHMFDRSLPGKSGKASLAE